MSVPLLKLDSLPTAGLTVPLGAWALGVACEVAAGMTRVSGQLSLLRRGPHVLVKGELAWAEQRPCDRCGELLESSGAAGFACVYSPMVAVPERGEDADGGPEVPEVFSGEADEVGEYEGDALDLGLVVREALVLERTARLRCADLVAEADAACLERWRGRAGTPASNEEASPFRALRGLRAAEPSPPESDKP